MKSLLIILILNSPILCKAQALNNYAYQTLAFNKKTDSVRKAFDSCTKTIDTVIRDKDSLVIKFKNKDGIIIKDETRYYYSGYIAVIKREHDTTQKKLYKDSATLLEIINKYYNLKGKIVYTVMLDLFRGTGSDDPGWGDITYYITGDTLITYRRFIYDSFDKPLGEILCTSSHECKKIIYQYDNNKIINQNEEPTEIDKFWND